MICKNCDTENSAEGLGQQTEPLKGDNGATRKGAAGEAGKSGTDSRKRRLLIVAGAAILLLCLAAFLACTNSQKNTAYHTKPEQTDESPQAKKLLTESAGSEQYQAYYELCMKDQETYGNAGRENVTGDAVIKGGNLTGLCIVRLFDFDKDGNQELILVFRDESKDDFSEAYQYEIWAWQDGKMIDVLETTDLNSGQDGRRWISAVEKDGTIYLEQCNASGMETFRYLQYENGTFVSGYESRFDQYAQPPVYEINGENVSAEEYMEKREAFPQSGAFGPAALSESGEPYSTEDEFLIYVSWIVTEEYAERVLEETAATIEVLREGRTTEQE